MHYYVILLFPRDKDISKLETWTGDMWKKLEEVDAEPRRPKGGMANTLRFKPVKTSKLRVIFEHIGLPNVRSGVTEVEVWEKSTESPKAELLKSEGNPILSDGSY